MSENESRNSKCYVCQCFYTNNIYLKDYAVHVVFKTLEQFNNEYKIILRQKGCVSPKQFSDVLSQIEAEVDRRKNLGSESRKRKKIIKDIYVKLYPEIYFLKEDYLMPEFKELVKLCRQKKVDIDEVMKMTNLVEAERVVCFPVFTEEFCNLLISELEHFENSNCPKGRPNTMNKYGILMDEIGFDDHFLTPLREEYLQCICRVIYPDWGGGFLDSHKAFIVKYKVGEDIDLSNHFDNAEVTLNVSLGKQFDGGSLYFSGMCGTKHSTHHNVEHKPGIGVLHRGQHMHGASPITSGERYNLIIWMRASCIRNSLCPMCGDTPELVEVVDCGDGFTVDHNATVNVCNI